MKIPCTIRTNDWQSAGLNAPSYLRLSKLVTIEEADMLSVIGVLSESDRSRAFEANIRFARSVVRA